jgi:hypothetical protein
VNDWHFDLGSAIVGHSSKFRDAAASLAKNLSAHGACSRCDPSSCSNEEKVYFRIDDVAPSEVTATTHFLKSIPTVHRIPKEALKNLTAYFSAKEHVHPSRKYFFEFNPSILKLPKNQRTLDRAIYLASFRVSTCHDCVPNNDDYMMMVSGSRSSVSHTEYLGLAILDRDLSILQEVVVNMKSTMRRFQDPRLFVLNDQLYVGSYHSIRPLWLMSHGVDRKDSVLLEHVWPDAEMPKHLMMQGVRVGTKGHCSNDWKTQNKGKNLNYFLDSRNDTIVEIKAMGPYEKMNMSQVCDVYVRSNASFIQSNATIPYPSFGTTEELDLSRQNFYDPVHTDERGSACCVSIQHPDGRWLRLGISHSKTVYGHGGKRTLGSNQFFSSFYAFEADSPYKVLARTGRFCFGFPKGSEISNPYSRMQMRPMTMIDVEYTKCPRIHFVSGMVEKADDPTKVIVAYGVNDCVPRMVTIDKSDILRMLFSPFDMISSSPNH